MIRERVSTHGTVRPLEAEEDLPALQVAPELLGVVSETWVRRYIAAKERHEKKFAARYNHIAKRRERALAKLRQSSQSRPREEEAVLSGWSLPWALDVDELPPPSSVVARCDTAEALGLVHSGKRHLRLAVSVLPKKKQKAFWRQGSSAQVSN
jgi:hypothetical protein